MRLNEDIRKHLTSAPDNDHLVLPGAGLTDGREQPAAGLRRSRIGPPWPGLQLHITVILGWLR
jgi:hypothetical protein